MNAASKMMLPAECKSLAVSGKIEVLSQCIEFVFAHVTEAGFVSSRRRKIELVVEAVVANIYRHEYDDQPGPVEICCRRVDAQRLLLEFADCARPFDILEAPRPDRTVDLDQREVGGLGVPLIRAMVDEASYSRDRNILRLVVRGER